MNRQDLEAIICNAINILFSRDANLLEQEASEWAIAHRLAVYLEPALFGWNIDCEYNRQGEQAETKKNAAGQRVRPDIIIHHRGRVEKCHNLLAIEIKKDNSGPDAAKVSEYTALPSGDRKYQYLYGLAMCLSSTTREFELKWFENGSAK